MMGLSGSRIRPKKMSPLRIAARSPAPARAFRAFDDQMRRVLD
jgi:hypothetical protein